MTLIEKYITRQLVRPFALGVFVITFLLSMDFLFDYLDLFLGKGVALGTVLRLFFLGLGWMLALSIPCGVLVGTLMTYGHLSQDNEIIAMKASGISPMQIMRPSLIFGVIVSIGLVLFQNYVLPNMNHSFANLMLAINKARPTAEIQEGVFIDHFDGYSLFIRDLNDRNGQMKDVLIYDFSKPGKQARTIIARRGLLTFNEKLEKLTLHLRNGEMHETGDNNETPTYRIMEFKQHILNIDGVKQVIDESRHRARGQRELSIGPMLTKIEDYERETERYLDKSNTALGRINLKTIYQLPGMGSKVPLKTRIIAALRGESENYREMPDSFWTTERGRFANEAKVSYFRIQSVAKQINQYWVEIHKKFSIPFACIVFVLIGAPLGIRARRGGLAAGFFSVGFFIFYYLCLIGGEQLADRSYLPPWISMWLPNIVLGALGLWLTTKICEIQWFARKSKQD